MEVIVHSNREVRPNRLFVGNQYENKIEKVKFSFPDYEGYHYLIINKSGDSYAVPLLNDVFYVDSLLTFKSGIYESHAVISGKKLEQTTEIDGSVLTFISNTISLIVKSNKINAGSLSEAPLPQNIQIVYDELFNTYEKIKSDYDSGAFDGKDGYSPTLDVTPIDNGNRITINDINGEKEIDVTNGIDGQSAYELAVKNGFEGTEQEWLESLRYDHSDEFTSLANQVKQDAQSSAESAANAETAMNQANQTAQDNIEAIQQASAQAQEDITNAKTTSVNAVVQAQQTAEQSIAAKHSEAVQAIESAQSTAETAIDAKQVESVQAVETAKEEATQAIETEKTEAVAAIETAKDEAIEEIENTGVPLEDIEKLAIKQTSEGNPTIISDSAEWRLQNLNVYGQSSQDGTPSPESPVEIISKEVSEIKVTGANILKFKDIEEATINGITYSAKDGLIKVRGTAERNFEILFYDLASRIPLLEGQTYIFNPNPIKGTETVMGYLDFTNSTTLGFSITNKNLNKPKTLNKREASYPFILAFSVKTGQTVDMEYKPQVLMSNVLLPYEPYKSQTITLAEPITLRGIPVDSDGNVTIDGQQYVADEICEKDGVIGVERNIHERTLNGTESWNIDTQSENTTRFYTPNEDGNNSASLFKSLSNYLHHNLMWSKDEEGVYVDLNNTVLRINKSIVGETKESINQWLQGLNPQLKILNIMIAPIFEPLPEDIQSKIKALKTYYPNTVINTGAWTKVEYVADTQKWIEKKLTGVTELALGGK